MEYENVNKLINAIKNYKATTKDIDRLYSLDNQLNELNINSTEDLDKLICRAKADRYFIKRNGGGYAIERKIEEADHYKDLLKVLLEELDVEFELSTDGYRDEDGQIDIDYSVSLNNGREIRLTDIQYEFFEEIEKGN